MLTPESIDARKEIVSEISLNIWNVHGVHARFYVCKDVRLLCLCSFKGINIRIKKSERIIFFKCSATFTSPPPLPEAISTIVLPALLSIPLLIMGSIHSYKSKVSDANCKKSV